jgi:hypothetical protein
VRSQPRHHLHSIQDTLPASADVIVLLHSSATTSHPEPRTWPRGSQCCPSILWPSPGVGVRLSLVRCLRLQRRGCRQGQGGAIFSRTNGEAGRRSAMTFSIWYCIRRSSVSWMTTGATWIRFLISTLPAVRPTLDLLLTSHLTRLDSRDLMVRKAST